MRVTIPDDLADVYEAQGVLQGQSTDQVVTERLTRFARFPFGTPTIVLSGEPLARVQQATGGLPLRNEEDTATRVETLAGVTFHHVRLDFSPGQLQELAHRAERQGKTVALLAADIIRQVTEQFFHGTPGGAAAHLVSDGAPKRRVHRKKKT